MKTVALLVLSALVLCAQESVQVTGAVKQALTLTAEDLAKMPRASVRGKAVYEGVWLNEVLKKAGVPFGKELTGYVVAQGKDGYQAVFSIGETDPTLVDNEILLADTADGRPGAFRLVVPTDKRGARWVRMLVKLEVVQLKK